MDLLDDRMVAVSLVGCDGVQDFCVGGGEERVKAPRVEQGVLTGGLVLLGVEVRDPAHDEAPGHLVGLLLRGEGGERYFGDFCPGDPAAAGLVEDGVETPVGVSLDVIIIAANPRTSKVFYSGAFDPNAEGVRPACRAEQGRACGAQGGSFLSHACVSS